MERGQGPETISNAETHETGSEINSQSHPLVGAAGIGKTHRATQ